MRLSATFNFFDAGELLIPALRSIRSQVQHISIVYQNVSNYGNRISKISLDALKDATELGLANDVICYEPNLTLTGAENEYTKRKIGLNLAQQVGATHIMLCDVDEFYETDQLANAKKTILDEDIAFSTVRYEGYCTRISSEGIGLFRVTDIVRGNKSVQENFVPFIAKLNKDTVHELSGWYPDVLVDGTRRVTVRGGKHHKFLPEDIVMHHMSGVRLDIEEKLQNSSANGNPELLNEVRQFYENFAATSDEKVTFGKLGTAYISETADNFGIIPVLTDLLHSAQSVGNRIQSS